MKRFSLNKKRASKVLALTLLAALVVPSVSVQKTSAASTGSTRATVPDPVMTVDFADTDSYIMSSSVTGKQLRLSNATDSVVWGLMNKDGNLVTGSETTVVTKKAQMVTGKSYATGATVDMYRLDSYVWDDIDVAPTAEAVTISSGDAIDVKTTALALKDSVENGGTYPGGLNDYTELQWKKVYNSGVQVTNPFAQAKYRGETGLYDESRYSFSNIAKTATAVVQAAAGKGDNYLVLNTATKLGESGSQYSGPDTSKGITISFWAQSPVDPDEGALKDTNFFEFVNKKSLVYNPDQVVKAYVAAQIDQVNEDKSTDNEDSEGYKGTIATGRVVAVGNNNGRRVLGLVTSSVVTNEEVYANKKNDAALNVGNQDTYFPKATAAPIEVTFVKDMGSVACLIPSNISWYNEQQAYYTENLSDAKPISSLVKNEKGTLLKPVWESTMTTSGAIVGLKSQNSVGIRHMLIVATNETDESGNTKVYGLTTTTVMPTDSTKWAESDYATGQYKGFTVDANSDSGYGDNLQVKEGATGVLFADQAQTYFGRDYAQEDDLGSRSNAGGYTGTYINANDEGDTGSPEARNNAYVNYTNNAALGWHYYTVTITDAYFQMYQDGKACDRASWAAGDKFNLGSGLYDGKTQSAWLTDAQRLYGVRANQWWPTPWSSEDFPTYYGYLFGQSVMSFITDPDTRLYIGGKTQRTAEGTLIADMAFFDEALTAEQVSLLFDSACKGTIKKAAAPAPTAETALEIGTPVRPEPAFGQSSEEGLLGDVNGDEAIDSKDALAVLKHSLQLDPGEGFNAAVADVNADEAIDSKDALEILKYSLGLIDKFSSED